MAGNEGIIVLMGSGELTGTMVEVHKELLGLYGVRPRAVFIDTPAGFQLNVDHLGAKASSYFQERIRCPLSVASYRAAPRQEEESARQRQALRLIGASDYILIGPGSPTYALRQWLGSPVPELLVSRIRAGACLTAASAAALTVGRLTLPVYEIYKVGEEPHWVAGMDLLGRFGFNLAVVPHWNNAEGGNHDTRFCFMGAPRFAQLQEMIEDPVDVLGLDEHTALVLDLGRGRAVVKGIGRVVLRRRGRERIFTRGDIVPLDYLRGASADADAGAADEDGSAPGGNSAAADQPAPVPSSPDEAVWMRLHGLSRNVRSALDRTASERVTESLLDLERLIWREQHLLQETDSMGAAREMLRELIALTGSALENRPASREACLAPLVRTLLEWRERLRASRRFADADTLRTCLQEAGIVVEDRPEGVDWRLQDAKR